MNYSKFMILNAAELTQLSKLKSIELIIDLITIDNKYIKLSPSHGGEFDHRFGPKGVSAGAFGYIYNLCPSFIHFARGFKVPSKYKNNILKYYELLDQLFLFRNFNPHPIKQANYLFKLSRPFEYFLYNSKDKGIQKIYNFSEINRIIRTEYEQWIRRDSERFRIFNQLKKDISKYEKINSICIISDTHKTTYLRNRSFKFSEIIYDPEIHLIEMLLAY